MKKYVVPSFFILLFAFYASPTRANSDENVTKRRPERAVEVQEVRQDRRENIKDKAQNVRSAIAENHGTRLERRFAFYYSRLSNIITRIQTRIDTVKAQGKDVVSMQAKLDGAKNTLKAAKTKGGEAVAAFKAIDPAKYSEQKSEALAARDLAQTARKLFVETRELLKEAVQLLKASK